MTNFWAIVGAVLVAKSIWFAMLASALVFKKVRIGLMRLTLRIGEEFTELDIYDWSRNGSFLFIYSRF